MDEFGDTTKDPQQVYLYILYLSLYVLLIAFELGLM